MWGSWKPSTLALTTRSKECNLGVTIMQKSKRNRFWLAVLLLAAGLLGHLLAANVEGGRSLHYRHHVLGFVLLTAASAIVVGMAGHFFWRGRRDVTLLVVGALQAVFGFLIYLMFSRS